MAVYETEIIRVSEIAEGTVEMVLRRPEKFSFEAGQYAQVAVAHLAYGDPKGASRVFSMASPPTDKRSVSFAFRNTGSGMKRTIAEAGKGMKMILEGPYGFYTFPKSVDRPLVLVAGGIGITPYMSMIRFAREMRSPLRIALVYANANRRRAAYLSELKETARERKEFSLHEVYGKLNRRVLADIAAEHENAKWHIAGPPGMVEYARSELIGAAVDEESIYAESFTGY